MEKNSKEKWIQDAIEEEGALSKALGIPEEENIPLSLLKKKKKELQEKAEGDKTLSDEELELFRQINLAITLKTKVNKKANLLSKTIKLAHTKPSLREKLLPLIEKYKN